MKGFKNVNALVGGRIICTDIAFDNAGILAVGDGLDITEVIPVANDSLVCPGFIDEHIHGAAGSDGMDASVEAISNISKAIAKEGTTAFLVTTMTQSKERIKSALSAVNEYIDGDFDDGAKVLGVHLEGPFISKKHVGAQPAEYVAKPSVSTFSEYEKSSGSHIKIVSLAPEEDGAVELISYLKERGIVASAGHTDAKHADIERAMKAGLKSITHTYNAQTPLHHREIGVVGSAFTEDELNCEIIADCIHVCPDAIRLLVKNKPNDKVTLITDSMRAKHLPDGVSELGGQTVYVKNGEARLKDGTLAGSVLKMNVAIKNMVERVGVRIERAVAFATENPAKNLSLFSERGSITVGKVADFAVLRPDFSVEKTIRDGRIIFEQD